MGALHETPDPASVGSLTAPTRWRAARVAGVLALAALAAAAAAGVAAGAPPAATLLQLALACALLAASPARQALAVGYDSGLPSTIHITTTALGGWVCREEALDAATEVADAFVHEASSFRLNPAPGGGGHRQAAGSSLCLPPSTHPPPPLPPTTHRCSAPGASARPWPWSSRAAPA